jgi:hypothetical protein
MPKLRPEISDELDRNVDSDRDLLPPSGWIYLGQYVSGVQGVQCSNRIFTTLLCVKEYGLPTGNYLISSDYLVAKAMLLMSLFIILLILGYLISRHCHCSAPGGGLADRILMLHILSDFTEACFHAQHSRSEYSLCICHRSGCGAGWVLVREPGRGEWYV